MHYFTFRHKDTDIQDELNFDSYEDFKVNYEKKKKKWYEISEKIHLAQIYDENNALKRIKRNNNKYDRELLNFYHICYSPYHVIFKQNNFHKNFIFSYIIPYISIHNETPIIRYTNFEYIFGLIDKYMENQNDLVKFDKIYEEVIENDPIASNIFNKKIFNSFHYFINKNKNKRNKFNKDFPNYISLKMIFSTLSEGFKIYTHLLKIKEKQDIVIEIINLFNLRKKIFKNQDALKALIQIADLDLKNLSRNDPSRILPKLPKCKMIDIFTEEKIINNISLPKDHLYRKVYVLHKLSIIKELTDQGYSSYQINDLISNILDTSYKTVENHINTINSLTTKDSQLDDEWYFEYLQKLKNLKSVDLQNSKKREILGFMLKNM